MRHPRNLSHIVERLVFVLLMSAFLYFVFIGNPFSTSGVAWDRTILNVNRTRCKSVVTTPDNGFIIIGDSDLRGTGGQSAYLVKTNSIGKVQWQKKLGGAYNIENVFGQATSDGCLIITGYWRNTVYVAKTTMDGDLVWERVIERNGYARVFSLTEVPDGGYAVVGYSNHEMYLLRLDASGGVEWEKLIGDGHSKQGNAIHPTSDGGFIIAGNCDLNGIGEDDVYLAKTDSLGNLEWQRNYGGHDNDHANSMHVLDDGYIIAGTTIKNREIENEAYLLKTDLYGELVWDKSYAKATPVMVYDMQLTPDSGFILTGGVHGRDEMPHNGVFIMKTDNEGNLKWDKVLSTQSDDFGTCIRLVEDGYIVAGNRNNNVFILKIRE